MKMVTITFKNGKSGVFKINTTSKRLMSDLPYDFLLRNKEVPIIKPLLSLSYFYDNGINDMLVSHFFKARIVEVPLDGRCKESRDLPYFTFQKLVDNY